MSIGDLQPRQTIQSLCQQNFLILQNQSDFDFNKISHTTNQARLAAPSSLKSPSRRNSFNVSGPESLAWILVNWKPLLQLETTSTAIQCHRALAVTGFLFPSW